jgi:hypothetical protein
MDLEPRQVQRSSLSIVFCLTVCVNRREDFEHQKPPGKSRKPPAIHFGRLETDTSAPLYARQANLLGCKTGAPISPSVDIVPSARPPSTNLLLGERWPGFYTWFIHFLPNGSS